jgi:hypothetical protein
VTILIIYTFVPTQRVLTTIGRKLGASTEELAELHDVST